jgi:hypothetical protein
MQDTAKSYYRDQALIRTQIYEVTKKVIAGETAADYRLQNPIKKVRIEAFIADLAAGMALRKTCG